MGGHFGGIVAVALALRERIVMSADVAEHPAGQKLLETAPRK